MECDAVATPALLLLHDGGNSFYGQPQVLRNCEILKLRCFLFHRQWLNDDSAECIGSLDLFVCVAVRDFCQRHQRVNRRPLNTPLGYRRVSQSVN